MNKKEKQQQQQQQQPKKGGGKQGGEKGKQQQKNPAKAPKVDQSEDVKREQKLQAIILADSFATSFRPITSDQPKVLLPLVNAPMLEYTLEFLSQSGVEEVTVLSSVSIRMLLTKQFLFFDRYLYSVFGMLIRSRIT